MYVAIGGVEVEFLLDDWGQPGFQFHGPRRA